MLIKFLLVTGTFIFFIAHGVITKLEFRNTARVLFLWCIALDLWGMI